MSRLMAIGVREDRALAMLMGACLVLFMSQWPYRARQAHETGGTLTDTIQHDAVGLIFVLPLLAYGLAALPALDDPCVQGASGFLFRATGAFLGTFGQHACGGIGWDG
jgi:ABC-type amino acid transport system permease subunit